MSNVNVLLVCGGGGPEHSISQLSADFIEAALQGMEWVQCVRVELTADGSLLDVNGGACELRRESGLIFAEDSGRCWGVDYVIPCIHGYPGETGDIQSYLELLCLPYFGNGAEASRNCFNKITSKLWLTALDIPVTPYVIVSSMDDEDVAAAQAALQDWGSVFIKASSQGSSVGCYQVDDEAKLESALEQAFNYSPYVLVEKTIKARELEVAVYEYVGETIATLPGEILCPEEGFYSYDEKYDAGSHSTTDVVAAGLSPQQVDLIRGYSIKAFSHFKLRHLARIDFFLLENGEIYLNEINTFPGMTEISMFPKMQAQHGHRFDDYLLQTITAGKD